MIYLSSISNKKNRHSKNKGFTLIEMLVAVGLFSVVMLVAVAAILSIIGNNRRSQGINSVANNLNFAIESMVRDMKTGYLYKCSWPIERDTNGLCTGDNPKTSVAFFSTLSGEPTPVQYSFREPSGTFGEPNYVPGYIVKRTGTGDDVELTSRTEVDIQSMKMYVQSPAPGSGSQPGIFLIITGKAILLDSQSTDFGLQTFISQRILNL